MDHPYEELVGYLDGSLSDDTLAAVQAHLSSCPSCAADIQSATIARDALGQLEEISQPDGLVARAKRQVTGPSISGDAAKPTDTSARASAGPRERYKRWTSGALAAAAVIAVVFVGGTMLMQRQRSGDLSTQMAALPAPQAGGDIAGGEQTTALQDLATAERDRYAPQFNGRSAAPSMAPAPAEGATESSAQPGTAAADEASKQAPGALSLEEIRDHSQAATHCLRASGSGSGELLRIYRGEVDGVPSYFGIYLQGPDPKAQPDRVSVWVASQGDCEVLGYAQAYLIYPSPSPAPEGFDWPSP